MAYIIKGSAGKGKNKATVGSIPLPNKERVRNYLKRSPLGNSNTEFTVRDTRKKKTYSGTRTELIYGPFKKKPKFS